MNQVKHSWVVLVLLAFSSFCYSEEVFETSANAAANGLSWQMSGVLPPQSGLSVNGVIYRYTTVKDPNSDMVVNVQNENALSNGFIFRETDDWSGVPGNTINKTIRVLNIPGEFWGDGSIEILGEGSIENANVVYSYQYDPCFDPQTSPECPGYKDPTILFGLDTEVVDPLDDDLIQDELDRKAALDDEDQEDRDRKRMRDEEKEEKEDLEELLGIKDLDPLQNIAQQLHNQLQTINNIPTEYYTAMPGGYIHDGKPLKDGELPQNRSARRMGFAQDRLHNEMVKLQFQK